ncbi:PLP-dependent aminotransferase family protein [Pseudomonas sp. LRF_L74]|uniref:aminotransferase-like domain-containing protein n=1 Tax=Pseudomonas sp. LRF_L74 TaxID=3369422 RepID=UPI003F63ACE5
MPKAQYTELAALVAEDIQSGAMPPGTRLATHRAFAEKHGVALATATRAYKELERLGLIVGEKGRGVFVRDLGLPLTLGVEQTAAEGLIDLVFNMPGDVGDSEILRAGLKRLASAGDLDAMLRYQPHSGRYHERKIIASYLARLGAVDPEHLLITSGGQHGLALTVLALLRRGDTVGTDTLTYPGFKSAAALNGLRLVPIEGVGGFMSPEVLDRKCREEKLQAIYLMPTVHNPLGSVMDKATRLGLVDVARRHDLLIIEDSAYAFLESDPPPCLLELAPERTIHIGGFSKSLATGLRLGYLVSPDQYLDKMTLAIRATTWNTPALISALVTGWIEDGTLAIAEESRRMDGAFRQHLCREVFNDMLIVSHENASFSWLPLAGGQRAEPIITRLKAQGIAVSSGDPFSVTEAAPQALRIAFGGIPKQQLRNAFEIVYEQIIAGYKLAK